MQAKACRDYLTVSYAATCEGQSIIAVPCRDYDEYLELPFAVDFEAKLHALTGWNSDRQQAYYKTGVSLARVLERRQA